jgi:hypothetical protein
MNAKNHPRRSIPAGRRLRIWFRATCVALGVAVCHVSLALAEKEAGPPTEEKPWLQWILLIAFVILCTSIAFKNPKRSHLG